MPTGMLYHYPEYAEGFFVLLHAYGFCISILRGRLLFVDW